MDAGPSSSSSTATAIVVPNVFLPPAPSISRPSTHLRATDDLLGRLRLLTAYDAHVRPYVRPVAGGAADVEMTYVGPGAPSSSAAAPIGPTGSATPLPNANLNIGANLKGKGKGKQLDEPMAIATPSAADAAPPTDKKKKKDKHSDSYRGLIHNVPGKHSMKKDTYLTDLIRAPPRDRMNMNRFDAHVLTDAFHIQPGVLHGFNPASLFGEDDEQKKLKKKRKKNKKREQEMREAATTVPAPTPSGHSTNAPTPNQSHSHRPQQPPSYPSSNNTNSTPHSLPSAATNNALSMSASAANAAAAALKRGKIRKDRDEGQGPGSGGVGMGLAGVGGAIRSPSAGIGVGTPGSNGILNNRPLKKRKTDHLTPPQQQPTPRATFA